MKKHNFNAGPSILPREVIENTACRNWFYQHVRLGKCSHNFTGNALSAVWRRGSTATPRLEKNKEDLEKYSYKGWDGREFLRWYDEFNEFLDAKQLRTVYPTVDDLCVAMGTVSYEHQGRKIESARMNNLTDAYVVNGWESELTENYSGIVDCFRYPKSPPTNS